MSVLLVMLTGLFLLPGQLIAKPKLEPLGPNVADLGSAYYRFWFASFHSTDNQRHYKVWIGIPRKAAPKKGFPVLYMLDGNAAMAYLSENKLATIFAGSPPILVAIGYETHLPFDVKSRALDYTPSGAGALPPQQATGYMHYPGGGSQAFRALLLKEIIPWAESIAASDPQQRAIWGHSFGGLFVLDTLYASCWFKDYFAAAPSLGWGNQRIIQLASQATPAQLGGKKLFLMAGDGSSDRRKGLLLDQPDAENRLVNALQNKGLEFHRKRYPGQSHGEMFASSLTDTLHQVAY